jgi:hypothetical protein
LTVPCVVTSLLWRPVDGQTYRRANLTKSFELQCFFVRFARRWAWPAHRQVTIVSQGPVRHRNITGCFPEAGLDAMPDGFGPFFRRSGIRGQSLNVPVLSVPLWRLIIASTVHPPCWAFRRRQNRNRNKVKTFGAYTLCYAIVLPGRKSGFRARFRPGPSRERKIGPPAGRKDPGKPGYLVHTSCGQTVARYIRDPGGLRS